MTKPYYDEKEDKKAKDAYYKGIKNPEIYDLTRLSKEKHTNPRKYSPSHELYPEIDKHEDGKLYSIYSGTHMDFETIVKEDEVAHQNQMLAFFNNFDTNIDFKVRDKSVYDVELWNQIEEKFPLNCEHVAPQRWFNRKEPQRGDLHHLFACEPKCNSYRSSHPYLEISDNPKDDCGSRSTKQNAFYPANGRSIVARATLYFFTRYPEVMNEENATKEHLDTLVKWSKENEPSPYEKHRNREIELRQGNRNPFIDYPELAILYLQNPLFH